MNITDKQATRELYMKAYNNNKNEVDARIADGIEKNRKGNCRLKLTDSNGAPLAGKKIKIKQKTHDFNFGANIFLLDEFESEKDNAAYRKLFKEHFNAVRDSRVNLVLVFIVSFHIKLAFFFSCHHNKYLLK